MSVFLLFILLFSPTAIMASHPDDVPGHIGLFIRYLDTWQNDRLSLPSDVTADRRAVYVVDSGNHRVVVFDHQGGYLRHFGSRGSGDGQLLNPVGIALDHAGRIYVADRGNQRVQIYSNDGRDVGGFPTRGQGGAITPIDIAVSVAADEIYVTGNKDHRVSVFDRRGRLLRSWGGEGLLQGQLRYPGSIQWVDDDRVAVVDILNTRVQLFDTAGNSLAEVGGWGVTAGHFVRPKGVAVDRARRLYISDSYMNLIQVFDDGGRFLHLLQLSGAIGGLETPTGIDIGPAHRLYVAEMLADRVAILQLQP